MNTPDASPVLGIGKEVDLPFDEAVSRTEARLKEQGFGILTRIDVRATLKEKLDVDMEPFVILGSCNPSLAHRALGIRPEISLLMPCNVVIRCLESGKVRVEAMNPALMAGMFPDAMDLVPVATEASEKIEKAIAEI